MPVHREALSLPYAPEALFDLVADIARYPDFVPGYREARILRRLGGNRLLVEQAVGVGPAPIRFHTTAELRRPERIDIRGSTPFGELAIGWRFTPLAAGCRVAFAVDYRLAPLLGSLARPWFELTSRNIVRAFVQRAHRLYGVGGAGGDQ